MLFPFRSVWLGIRLFSGSSSLYAMTCLKLAYLMMCLASCTNMYLFVMFARFSHGVCGCRHSRGTVNLYHLMLRVVTRFDFHALKQEVWPPVKTAVYHTVLHLVCVY